LDGDVVEFRIRMTTADAAAFEQRIDRLVDLADAGLQDGPPDGAGADTLPLETPDPQTRSARPARHIRRVAAICAAVCDTVARGGPDRTGEDDHLVILQVTAAELAQATASTTPTTGDVPAGTRPTRRFTVATGRKRTMTIPGQVLARLTCNADLRLAVSHPDGHPADIGRRSRRVPADLRRALLLRDRSCRFPGCDQRRHLHAHHVVHWAADGPTNLDNLLMLCSHHHRFIHDRDWRLEPVNPAAGHYRFLPPNQSDPQPHTGTLRGVPAGTQPTDGLPPRLDDPHPTALQPAWWDGDAYDLSWTIDAIAREILDPAIASTDYQPPPAMAAA
jgi:hypothetical protein